MSDKLAKLLKGRRFRPRMVRALRLVARGLSTREAAEAAGLASHQDLARAAREFGLGVRRVASQRQDAA